MPAILVHHRVSDYDTWLPHFEAHAAARDTAGVVKAIVWQSADDPNDVFVLMKAEDLAGLRGLAESEDLKQTMLKAGVQLPVEVHFLTKAGIYEH